MINPKITWTVVVVLVASGVYLSLRETPNPTFVEKIDEPVPEATDTPVFDLSSTTEVTASTTGENI